MSRRHAVAAALLLVLPILVPPDAQGVAPGHADVRPIAALAQADSLRGSQTPYAVAGNAVLHEERRLAKSRFRHMMLGYGIVWVALGAYLFSLNRRVARVGREVSELEGRLDQAEGSKPRAVK